MPPRPQAAKLKQTECKFCHETVRVKTAEDGWTRENGLHKEEQYLEAHADQYGGPCVQGSGLLTVDNNKPLWQNTPPEAFDAKHPFKHTLNLPKTDMPMRAVSNERELAQLKAWGF